MDIYIFTCYGHRLSISESRRRGAKLSTLTHLRKLGSNSWCNRAYDALGKSVLDMTDAEIRSVSLKRRENFYTRPA